MYTINVMLMNVMYYPRCIQRLDMGLVPFDKLAYFPPSPLPNCIHENMVTIIQPLFRLSIRLIVLIYFISFVYISAMQCSLCFNTILRILIVNATVFPANIGTMNPFTLVYENPLRQRKHMVFNHVL